VPESQISDNVKAYVDDVAVKTTVEDNFIADLVQTFADLRRYFWKLNLAKCVFGVPLGEILCSRDTIGHIVKWSVELGEFELEFCP
jgi:hypothetical protein